VHIDFQVVPTVVYMAEWLIKVRLTEFTDKHRFLHS